MWQLECALRGLERAVVESATTRASGGGEVGLSLDPPVINLCRSDCAGEVLTRSSPTPPTASRARWQGRVRPAMRNATARAEGVKSTTRRCCYIRSNALIEMSWRVRASDRAAARPRGLVPSGERGQVLTRRGALVSGSSRGPCRGVNHRRCTAGRAGPRAPLARQPRAASAFSPNARSPSRLARLEF